jgi:hypothetical protein
VTRRSIRGGRPFLDTVSKLLEAKEVEIEVASLDLGDQVQAKWLPLIGITYDPKAMLLRSRSRDSTT